MTISNGYVYAGNPSNSISIIRVKPLSDMMMLLTFDTGETRLFDATVLDGPVFRPLRDPAIFQSAEIDHGIITWMDGSIDCAPEFMYEHSFEYVNVS